MFIVMCHFCIGIKLFENILCNFLLLLFLLNSCKFFDSIKYMSDFKLLTDNITYIIEIHILIFFIFDLIIYIDTIFRIFRHICSSICQEYIYIKENFKILLLYTVYLKPKKCKIYNQDSPRISTR